MNTRRPAGKHDEGTPARNNPALWFAAILGVAGGAWFLLVFAGGLDSSTSLIAVAVGLLIVSFGTSTVVRSRRRAPGRRQAPSPEELHGLVDADALRAVRDGRGGATAAHELRRRVPGLSLADAVKFVDGL